MTLLHRYWFEFEPSLTPSFINMGCGVTAYDYDDAVSLLSHHVFNRSALASGKTFVIGGDNSATWPSPDVKDLLAPQWFINTREEILSIIRNDPKLPRPTSEVISFIWETRRHTYIGLALAFSGLLCISRSSRAACYRSDRRKNKRMKSVTKADV